MFLKIIPLFIKKKYDLQKLRYSDTLSKGISRTIYVLIQIITTCNNYFHVTQTKLYFIL